MGIPVDRKPERAVQAKIRDKTKICTPDKLKTRKGDLAKIRDINRINFLLS